MTRPVTRRAALGGTFGLFLVSRRAARSRTVDDAGASYPIGRGGAVLGDGFVIRHGFTCENSWYNPGWWHAGEDWYAREGDTAGAGVYAIGAGEVVFVGSDYPGRVVIVRHTADRYSMYGHLDRAVMVSEGAQVTRGQPLGTVLNRTDGNAPSHLHFELRTFLLTDRVNGDHPSHGVSCGLNCPPGPGYWPIDAPELPVDLGWRNPTHALHVLDMALAAGDRLAIAADVTEPLPLWNEPADHADAEPIGELALAPGDTLTWIATATRDPAAAVTSAEGYRLWYRIEQNGERGWIEAAVADPSESGSDGRPSTVRLRLLPAVTAEEV